MLVYSLGIAKSYRNSIYALTNSAFDHLYMSHLLIIVILKLQRC